MQLYKTKPMAHQGAIQGRMMGNVGFGLFWEMGTGKSKPIVDEIAQLWRCNAIDMAIIISDNGCYENWSKTQFPAHMPDDISYRSYIWKSGKKKSEKEIENIGHYVPPGSLLPIISANVEAFSAKNPSRVYQTLANLTHKFKKIYICVDESTSIKTHDSVRTKQVIALGKRCAYRRILTGTPMTQDLFDIYSQIEFLGSHILGFSNFYTFRARYGVFETQYCGPGRSFQKVVGFKNQEELLQKIAPYTSRLKKTECIDLPPKVYLRREVELTSDQARAYKQMKAEGLAMLENKELATAATAMEVIIRLRQICCGFVKTEEGGIVPLPQNRVKELLRVIEESSGKVIIWCAFKEDVRLVVESLRHEFGEESVVHYYGDTSDEDRQLALTRFCDPNDGCRFFVGTAKTGGKSLTLVIADLVIYYSNDYSLEGRLQSEDRAHRIGQTKTVTYVDLIAKETVDEEVLGILQGKEEMARLTLKRLTEIIRGDKEGSPRGEPIEVLEDEPLPYL
jgi:SNF2 family DNA or RNA helicase